MEKINKKKLWIIEKHVSKLHRINTNCRVRYQNNGFKLFTTYEYLSIIYNHTESNSTNLGVFLTVH
jgi:hypothetical protein